MVLRGPFRAQLRCAVQAGWGCKPWDLGNLAAHPVPELLLAWPGISGLSLLSCSAGWLQDEAEPTRRSRLVLRGGVPESRVPGDTWRANSARHPRDMPGSRVTAVLVLLQLNPARNTPVPPSCSFAVYCTSPPLICPGRKFCRREIIVLNLFCPQTMVRSPSCRQEGTSSPSPSNSPSKLTFCCRLNAKGERSCLCVTPVLG